MSEYAPLRDAFQDINKMLIDKQQWDAKHEADREDRGLQRMQVESQLQDNALKRADLQRKAMLDQEAMKEVAVNIYDYAPQSAYADKKLFDDGDAGHRFGKALVPDIPDAYVDRSTGMVKDGNGDIIRRPKVLIANRATSAYGVVGGSFDPTEMINNNIQTATEKVDALQKEYDEVPVTNVAKRSEAIKNLTNAKTVLKEQMNLLEPERLLPFYQKRVDVLDQMAIKAAAAMAEPSLLAQLSHAAQRANADVLSIRSEITKKQEGALNRAARREERELALEAARVKGSASKEKVQQHYIGREDGKGGIVPGSVKVFNVPKDTMGTVSPEPGYKFVRDQELTDAEKKAAQAAGGKLQAGTIETGLTHAWSRATPDPNSIGGTKYQIVPANQPRMEAARRLIGENYDKFGNVFDAVSKTQRIIIESEKNFNKDLDILAAQQAVRLKQKVLTPTQMDMLAEKFAKTEGFYNKFGYTPKFEHRKSLDLAYPGVVGTPDEEEE